MSLIPYAGQDAERVRGRPPRLPQRERALMMFRKGMDTLFIADHLKKSECTALRWINTERSKSLGLPSPYVGSFWNGDTA